MSKKPSKLEKEYVELSTMGEEELKNEKVRINGELNTLNAKISGMASGIENLPEDSIKFQKVNSEIEKAKAEKTMLEKRLKRVEGISKNKTAIQRIIKYRDNFVKQATALKQEKADNEKKIDSIEKEMENNAKAKKEIEDEKESIETKLKQIINDLANIEKLNYTELENLKNKLNLEKKEVEDKKVKAETEIENINSKQENLAKSKTELENKNFAIDKKISKLIKEVSKCNLAWKCLFNNETWEQIHAKSLDGRHTKNNNGEVELKQSQQEQEREENTAEKDDLDKTIDIPKNDIMAALTNYKEPEKHPVRKKLRKFFSTIIHPIKSMRKWRQDKEDEELEEQLEEVATADKVEEKPEEKKVNTFEEQRDAFLTELQKMAEKPENNVGANLDQIDQQVMNNPNVNHNERDSH